LKQSEELRDPNRVYPEELLAEVLIQIEKDFNRAGFVIEKLENPLSFHDLISKLVALIKPMSSNQIQQLMYAIDLSEQVYLNVQTNPQALCELMIKRVLQKVVWRKKLS